MKEVYDELAYLFKKISIEDPNSMVDADVEDISDSTAPLIDETTGPREESTSALVGCTGNTDIEDDTDERDNEDHLITETKPLSLAEAKQAALQLHHFFLCNMDQKLAHEAEHGSYRVHELVSKMVYSSACKQRNLEDFYELRGQSE